ncbi:MAG: 4Fe-4S cluster-binding domain-containing protein [Thermoplasmatota archaeon]
MESTLKWYPHYYAIQDNKRDANYLRCQHIPIPFDDQDDIETLWNIHDTALKQQHLKESKATTSLLDLKITIAEKLFQHCIFCEHRCGINRNESTGRCRVSTSHIASAFLHHGEESILTPSYTIFFSGCNLSCMFCQNHDISQHQTGQHIPIEQMASLIEKQGQSDATNINLVGGEPTPHLLYILKTLQHCSTNLPVLWNSNMYCSIETMKLLDGIIDIYLTDFKFGNNHCAQQLAKISHYFNIVKRNHLLAANKSEILIRHLLLPNHIDCCTKPILSFVNKYLPQIPINLMNQYQPVYQAEQRSNINRCITNKEENKAVQYAKQLNLRIL